MIYIHKELELDDVEAKYPAAHYVMVDDKVRILAAIKKHWGARVTTVFPRQGHYALDAALVAKYPKPDITLERIGELQKYSLDEILAAAGNKFYSPRCCKLVVRIRASLQRCRKSSHIRRPFRS